MRCRLVEVERRRSHTNEWCMNDAIDVHSPGRVWTRLHFVVHPVAIAQSDFVDHVSGLKGGHPTLAIDITATARNLHVDAEDNAAFTLRRMIRVRAIGFAFRTNFDGASAR